MSEVVYSVELENKSGGSSKFWNCVVEKIPEPALDFYWSVTRTWGRIGTKGQSTTDKFYTEAKAIKVAESHAQKKLQRGYVKVGTSQSAATDEAVESINSTKSSDGDLNWVDFLGL